VCAAECALDAGPASDQFGLLAAAPPAALAVDSLGRGLSLDRPFDSRLPLGRRRSDPRFVRSIREGLSGGRCGVGALPDLREHESGDEQVLFPVWPTHVGAPLPASPASSPDLAGITGCGI